MPKYFSKLLEALLQGLPPKQVALLAAPPRNRAACRYGPYRTDCCMLEIEPTVQPESSRPKKIRNYLGGLTAGPAAVCAPRPTPAVHPKSSEKKRGCERNPGPQEPNSGCCHSPNRRHAKLKRCGTASHPRPCVPARVRGRETRCEVLCDLGRKVCVNFSEPGSASSRLSGPLQTAPVCTAEPNLNFDISNGCF